MSDKNDLAEDRTDWAEDRTIQANERTFAGWMRTGMASLALALGMRAVFGGMDPTWIAKAVATVFVVIAIMIFWAARNQACATLNRLNAHRSEPVDENSFTVLSSVLTLGAVLVGGVLWAL